MDTTKTPGQERGTPSLAGAIFVVRLIRVIRVRLRSPDPRLFMHHAVELGVRPEVK
jgi:hypothetical protein